jgi:WD40 repeat protein
VICLWDKENWKQKGGLALPKDLAASPYSFLLDRVDEGASVEKGVYVRQRDNRYELLDIKTGRLIRRLAGTAEEAHWPIFSASGDRIVAATKGAFQFFDVGTGKVLSRLPRPNVLGLFPDCPELSPRGTYVARNQTGFCVALHEVRSGKFLRLFPPRLNLENPTCSYLQFHFSSDERTLFGEGHQLLGMQGGSSREKVIVTLWDVQNGSVLQEMVVVPEVWPVRLSVWFQPYVGALALSPDRRLVALARTSGKDVEIWETASGTRRGVLTGHAGPVVSLSFSADGKHLASSSEDTTILVWDLNRPLRFTNLKDRLGADELAAHWQTLARPDAQEADRAI